MRQRLFREGGMIAVRLFGVVAGLATSAVTARVLGPADRGVYFYVITMAMVLSTFGNLGAPGANGYFAAREPATARVLARWSMIGALVIGGGLAGLFEAVTAFPALHRFSTHEGLWLIILTPLTLVLTLQGPILAGLQRFNWLMVGQVAQQVLLVVGFVAVAFLAPTPAAFLAVSILGSLLAFGLQQFATVRGAPSKEQPDFGAWIRYGMRAYGPMVLSVVVARVGVMFVKSGASTEGLGHYSVAVQFFDVLGIVPSTLALILFPSIMRDRSMTWAHCKSELIRMLSIAVAIAVVAAVALKPVIPIVFGPEFAPAYLLSLLFLPGFVALSGLVVASQYLAALGYPKAVMINWAIGAAVLLVLCPVSMQQFGVAGAAMATSAAYGVLAGLMIFSARKGLGSLG